MEHWWNEPGKRISKFAKEHLSQCNFVHQKSHMNCPGIDLLVSPFIDLWVALRTRRYFTVPYLSISVSCTLMEKLVLPIFMFAPCINNI
jgi:hypothetical protein